MLSEVLSESRNSRVLLQEDSLYGKHVVKILNDEFPSPQVLRKFLNEHDVLRDVTIDGVRKVLRSGKVENRHALFLEFINAISLSEFARQNPDRVACLQIAVQVAGILDAIHQLNIIHKDVTPANILVDPESLKVWLIDFGISTRLSMKNTNLGNPEKLEGTLRYVSPEQTGRMNRYVDYRTDLYSLGVILYELFTGVPPFDAEDAMGLVHAHIAGRIVPPAQRDKTLPPVLSLIISKLMSKNAEDRYQSANGLRTDLQQCLDQLRKSGRIDDFEIGRDDYSGKFQLVQKLYGRDNEVEELLNAFERVRDKHIELLLVAGYSGTGKSSLVHEIHKPITERRGYFIEGKFDQFQRAIPYFAIIQAFRSLVHLMLTEDETALARFRESILKAVGEEGRVLTDVLPDLELIIGKQPDIAEIPASDARNRFNYIFRRFAQAVCTSEHPITMFVDDMQWADSSSLDLLSVLLTDPDLGNFLCVCAYRDNEVSKTHPFIIAVEGLKESGVAIEIITIGNLSYENVNELISDSLKMDPDKTDGLTSLVYEKTGGNAFFVTQFLNSLFEEHLLHFDFQNKSWTWDIQEIKRHNLPDDVVALMADKIQRMPAGTQEVLKLAASIGAVFDLETLSLISGMDEESCETALQSAMSEGLVLTYEDDFRFAHDRIQQAVYSLIPERDRAALHLRIGRLMLERVSAEERAEMLFDIVNQLNQGIEILTDIGERETLASLNLHAGKKAKETSAFELGFRYTEYGIQLLGDDHWHTQEKLSVDLYTEAAETAFLSSKFEEMNAYLDKVLSNTSQIEEKIRPYEIRIQSLKAENKLPAALATGLELMAMLGEKLPDKPNQLKVMPDLLKTVRLLVGKSNEDIAQLPENADEIKRAAIRVCASIAPPSYWAKPDMFPFIIFRMIRLSLKYGNTAASAFGYATFGVIMVGVFNLIRIADRYGKLGLMVLDHFNAKEWVAQIYTPVYALILIWNQHIRNTLKPLQESYHIGLETGAIEFACINANIYCIHAYLIGMPLDRLEEEIEDYSASFKRFKQGTNWEYNEVYRQAALNFMGRSANPLILTGEAYNEVEMLQANIERENRISVFFIYFHKTILNNYFGEFDDANVFAAKARPMLDAVLAKLEVAYLHFHEALAALASMIRTEGTGNRKLKNRVRKNMGKLRKWAKYAPENYEHKYLLLQALQAQLNKRYPAAQEAFEKSIHLAGKHGFLHEEALASELAGEFYRERGNASLSAFYLRNAYQVYREWGAVAKMKDLQDKYPEIISAMATQRARASTRDKFEGTVTTTTMAEGNILDLNTVMKASATISGEIVLEKLLSTLMEILMENLGATRGVLMLDKDGELFIEQQSTTTVRSTEVLKARRSGLIPDSLITFVQRKKQMEVIPNALESKAYGKDSYVLTHKPLSILCYPVVHQGDLTGILYFENDMAAGVFTEERIELLTLLSGQIAISIENAILYESLETKVQERTAELNEEKKKSDALLLNILPEAMAEQLKRYGKTRPQRFELVSVMFTDFVDFTRISAQMNPNDLVEEIGKYFAEFDRIIGKYGLEKIKTIGDSYMCAGGLPEPDSGHVIRIVQAAIEIRDYMKTVKEEKESLGLEHFAIRIGIHSGPVVAGVVGIKKFAYDIWGDTVNTASRMESHCEPWQINISGDTLNLLADKIDFTHRGKVDAKSKGEIDMYYVKSMN